MDATNDGLMVYEKALRFWPYRYSFGSVWQYVVQNADEGASVLDMMCGSGNLLYRLQERRPDLKLRGVDISDASITRAKSRYPGIVFEVGNVLEYRAEEQFDVVLCTGALHHVSEPQQELALSRLAAMAKSGGFAVISDCYIDDYNTEAERMSAAAKLGYEYLDFAIKDGATPDVVALTLDILRDDVLHQECKTSYQRRRLLLHQYFPHTTTRKTWPNNEVSGYGDYVHTCPM